MRIGCSLAPFLSQETLDDLASRVSKGTFGKIIIGVIHVSVSCGGIYHTRLAYRITQ
jgi:hypothetical protein